MVFPPNQEYNVTRYVNNIRSSNSLTWTQKFDKNCPNAYLKMNLNKLVINKLNEDATAVFQALFGSEVPDEYHQCLDKMFYIGEIKRNKDPGCTSFYMFFFGNVLLLS